MQQRTLQAVSTTREQQPNLADHWISLSRADRFAAQAKKAAGLSASNAALTIHHAAPPNSAMAKD